MSAFSSVPTLQDCSVINSQIDMLLQRLSQAQGVIAASTNFTEEDLMTAGLPEQVKFAARSRRASQAFVVASKLSNQKELY
jgi:hypothetical protein